MALLIIIHLLINLECEPNEFACDGSRCIPKSKQCDYVFDCDDQTDERDCPEISTTENPIRGESQKLFISWFNDNNKFLWTNLLIKDSIELKMLNEGRFNLRISSH